MSLTGDRVTLARRRLLPRRLRTRGLLPKRLCTRRLITGRLVTGQLPLKRWLAPASWPGTAPAASVFAGVSVVAIGLAGVLLPGSHPRAAGPAAVPCARAATASPQPFLPGTGQSAGTGYAVCLSVVRVDSVPVTPGSHVTYLIKVWLASLSAAGTAPPVSPGIPVTVRLAGTGGSPGFTICPRRVGAATCILPPMRQGPPGKLLHAGLAVPASAAAGQRVGLTVKAAGPQHTAPAVLPASDTATSTVTPAASTPPSPAPMPSSSSTPSVSATPSSSGSPSPAGSGSPSPAGSGSPSPSPTGSCTPSPSASASPSGSPSASASPSPSGSCPPLPSPSGSGSPSASATPSSSSPVAAGGGHGHSSGTGSPGSGPVSQVGASLPPGFRLPPGLRPGSLGNLPGAGSSVPKVSFPTVAPGVPPSPAAPSRTRARVSDVSAQFPLDGRLIGVQLAGLAVLVAAVTMAVARLSLRRRTPRGGR